MCAVRAYRTVENASRDLSAGNCTKNQIKCRNCHSTNHISGDKICSKYKEFFVSKIAFKNQFQ